jgi:hypothetical protein
LTFRVRLGSFWLKFPQLEENVLNHRADEGHKIKYFLLRFYQK